MYADPQTLEKTALEKTPHEEGAEPASPSAAKRPTTRGDTETTPGTRPQREASAVKARKATPRKETKVEVAKRHSHFLRGTITDVLESEQPAFEHDDVQLLKFHGIYQQEDRDARSVARKTGVKAPTSFMIRSRIPGGRLSAPQYLVFDELASAVGFQQSLRITTRQTFQLHGVVKDRLRATVASMHNALVTTLAACGDVGRNVMAPPAPRTDPAYQAVRALADEVSDALAPRTGAYHEIWLNGEKVITQEATRKESSGEAPGAGDSEPLYGERYLPRKFKSAIALPEDNSVDVYTQDTGLIAVVDPTTGPPTLRGVNIVVGGGLGLTHRKADTFARLASPLGFTTVERAPTVVQAIVKVFRDHGNRTDRKHARIKYLVEDWGIDRFRDEVEALLPFQLEPWQTIAPLEYHDWLGPHEQGDGKVFYGIHIPNGRIADVFEARRKTAIAEIVRALEPGIVLTPTQNILLTDLDRKDVETVEAILAAYGVAAAPVKPVRRFAMACPALPTCGLALAESERAIPRILDHLEDALTTRGLDDETISVRMTGCPNGCARPYAADLGIVGRKAGHYDLYVGGRLAGDRLAFLWAEQVAEDAIVARLEPLLDAWARERRGDEGLGELARRLFARDVPTHIVSGAKDVPAEDVALARAEDEKHVYAEGPMTQSVSRNETTNSTQELS